MSQSTSDQVAYCARLEISASGHVVATDSVDAAQQVRDHPDLIGHARAFLASRLPSVKYSFVRAASSWLRVTLTRDEASPEPLALLDLAVTAPPYDLSMRELDVLTLIAAGLSNPEIGSRLSITGRTVAKHVESILVRLDQQGRAGVAAIAAEEGLLRLPVPGGGRSLDALAIGVLDRFLTAPTKAARSHRAAPVPRRRPIRIGAIGAAGGQLASDGEENLRGATLAVTLANERGGIGGRPIEIVPAPTDVFDAAAVTAALETLFAQDVDGVITPYLYPVVEAGQLIREYGAPYLHAGSSNGTLAAPTGFQVCPPETDYLQAFGRTLQTLRRRCRWAPQNRRLGFVETELATGLRPVDVAALDELSRAGWEVDFHLRVDAQDTDWSTVLRRLQDRNPAALLIAHDFPAELASFLHAFHANPTETLLYAVYTPSMAGFLAESGNDAEGLLWSTTTGVYDDPIGRRFRARYQETFHSDAGVCQAGLGFDQAGLLINAWRSVSNPRRYGEVQQELRMTPYRGVNGGYWFDTAEQTTHSFPFAIAEASLGHVHQLYQVQNGMHRHIGASRRSHFRLPTWAAGVR